MCDFDKVKSARLGTLIHNYRFLFRNGDIDSDFCDKCLDAMAKLAQAKTADEIDSVCKDVRYGDKHIAAIPLDTRHWDCPECKTTHDRDVNAAKNILTAGLAGLAFGENVSLV